MGAAGSGEVLDVMCANCVLHMAPVVVSQNVSAGNASGDWGEPLRRSTSSVVPDHGSAGAVAHAGLERCILGCVSALNVDLPLDGTKRFPIQCGELPCVLQHEPCRLGFP